MVLSSVITVAALTARPGGMNVLRVMCGRGWMHVTHLPSHSGHSSGGSEFDESGAYLRARGVMHAELDCTKPHRRGWTWNAPPDFNAQVRGGLMGPASCDLNTCCCFGVHQPLTLGHFIERSIVGFESGRRRTSAIYAERDGRSGGGGHRG